MAPDGRVDRSLCLHRRDLPGSATCFCRITRAYGRWSTCPAPSFCRRSKGPSWPLPKRDRDTDNYTLQLVRISWRGTVPQLATPPLTESAGSYLLLAASADASWCVVFSHASTGACDKKRCRTENPQRSINAKTFTPPGATSVYFSSTNLRRRAGTLQKDE